MPYRRVLVPLVRSALVVVLASAGLALAACTDQASKGTPAPQPATDQPATQEREMPPLIKEWVVNVVDDDSFTEGGITYSIALNLRATNPSQDAAGKYTGSATAQTTTEGTTGGHQLSASAVAKSSKLEFSLEGSTPAGDPLAPLTAEGRALSGGGSIVMAASGSGTIDGAAGGFSNTSGQNLKVSTQGSKVTLEVAISGHTYTFEGVLTPVEE